MKCLLSLFLGLMLFAQVSFAQVVSSTKDVTTAGTEVRLKASRTTVSSVLIQAKGTNTGNIYVGDSTVSSTTGIKLTAGQTLPISTDHKEMLGQILDLNTIWIDSSVNGEGVILLYLPTR